MNNFNTIQTKLGQFIRKYYTNELIKGGILFFAIGLLYFLFTLFIEYVLWLDPLARSILFWLFVMVELGLLIKFIALPLAKLFELQKGIDYLDASKIIGQHFPQVSDKLLNVLQLNQDQSKSELILASIEQKSTELKPIPFKLAINLKKNISYLKYAAIPVIIILLIALTGNFNWFSDSYERVVHYKTAFEPPAPFQFFVVNNNLDAIENKAFTLIVKTAGNFIPESAQIVYNNETYFLQQKGLGEFEYVFLQPKTSVDFQLFANNVTSKPYSLNVIEVPSLLSFQMTLDFPGYTKKKNEVLKSSGNAVVPEGTNVTWRLNTKSTNSVHLYAKDTMVFSSDNAPVFVASKRIYNNFDYILSTSNTDLIDYENFAFNIDVIKDEHPELDIKMEKDSLDLQTLYFYGQISDDYGLSKLQMVYYPSKDEQNKNYENIPISASNIAEFISAFPNNLNISEGIGYKLYFQVFDNDVINKYKSVKSNIFSYRKRTKEEEEQKKLEEQSETIQDLNKSLKKFDEQGKHLDNLTKNQKEKSRIGFSDRKKLESFLNRQKQQEEMMKNFNKKLKDNLEDFQNENNEEDKFKEDLKERLKQNEQQLKKDEKLLEELEKFKDKINNEELIEKLDELAKQNKNKKRSLQQLLELTKRFYVSKKLEKLQEELLNQALEQEKLSNEEKEKNTKEKQDALNERFENFKKELENLEIENKGLNKPMVIPRDKLDEKEVEDEQQKASEELGKQKRQETSEGEENAPKDNESQKNAQNSQKKAAKKIKKMSQNMKESMQMGGGEQMQEDSQMLRQILDNLVLFSFDQESLMERFKTIEVNHSKYASFLRKQNNLTEHFGHIDDSLFALSLRQPKLSEIVNKEITDVYFNIDKALDKFAENQLYQGVSNQQFAITATNNLSNFLSEVLDNMQEEMSPSKGQGKGDMQLPDIIMSQEQLNEMMKEGIMNSEEGKPKEDKSGKEGEKGKDGKKGKNGNDLKIKKSEGLKREGEQYGGEGFNEDLNGELYEIYKQQQKLRNALEDQLKKNGLGPKGENILKEMEGVELDLLNKGFTNQNLQKMMELQHQLLKLENATFQQGEDNKRESQTNLNRFNNTTNHQIPTAKQYFKTTEILNRQALPLHQVYKKKVQTYFKGIK